MQKFFCYDGCSFDCFDTAEEAREAAEAAIDDLRDCCDPEWPPEVENVFWGEVKQFSTATSVEKPEFADDELEYVEYKLTDA